ncbi:hypothetical protein [Anaerostipes sp.]|uniref:hypothetical protein n=1 Tax=Anaerostipes sp. TaxID=1872530 RepID=UPI0025B8F6E5|nr:hypothetical protein [Anaerostipes sp.]MBS7008848.1 hypothetical protein [Anaerostipes sp.]
MDIWENTVLTDQGKALQAKLLQGQTLNITRVTTGAKKVPIVDLRQQTDVTEGGYDITLQPSRTEDDKTVLPVLLENIGLKESYDLWQVGFFAKDPDEGEILFCISQASQAKHIPSEAESPGYSVTLDFYFSTSNTVPFEVVLNSNGLVNIEAYQKHTDAISEINSNMNILNTDLNNIKTEVSQKTNQTDFNLLNSKVTENTNRLKDYCIIREANTSITVATNGYSGDKTYVMPSVSGYKMIAVVQITAGNRLIPVYNYYCYGTTVHYWLHNGTSTTTFNVYFRCLYIRI